MKTYLILLPLVVLIPMEIFGQKQKWEVHIGLPNRYEGANALIEYYDNGYYIEAGFLDPNGNKGWQIKTNINGTVTWEKIISHNFYSFFGTSVVLDNEGNRYVAGTKYLNGTWPFIAKFDPCGVNIWCKILLDANYKSASVMDILLNESGEIIILCNYTTHDLKAQIYLECLDKNGEYLWKQQYAAKENHPWIATPVAYHLMQHNSDYYISGYCYWPYPTDTNHVFLRPLFIGIDSLFNEKWILPFAALDSVFGDAYSSIPLNDSVMMGVGVRRSYDLEAFSLLMFYNVDGEEIGYNQISVDQIGPGIISNYMRKVVKINDTTFVGAGFYEPEYSKFYNLDTKFDTSAQLFAYNLRPNVVGIPSLIKSSENNFVFATSIKKPNNDQDIYLYKIDENLESVPFDNTPYVYDSLCPTPIQSGIIDLTSCMVWTGTEEVPSPQQYYATIAQIPLTAYPNPAETEITLAFQNTEHHNNMLLECYNLFGQRVHSEKIYKGQQKTKLSIEQWQSGLYIAVVKSEGRVAGMVRFVRR